MDDATEMTIGSDAMVSSTTPARWFHGRESLPFGEVDSRAGLGETGLVDVLGGTELTVTLASRDVPLAPVTSLVAVLVLDGRAPVWLGPYGSDRPAVTIPLGAEGNGVIHVLAGTCDDWTFTGSWPITIADPAMAADCPTDLEGLHDWFDASDQWITVAGTSVDSMGHRGGVIGRYVPVRDDSGSYAGHEVTRHKQPITIKAGQRFTVRPRDRTVDVPSAWARFTGRPTTRELRSGWVEDLPRPSIDGRARLDGQGGFTVVAPRKPGRYMLVMNPVWRTRCLKTQDAELVVSVTVR
jgi:hypothetical protein